MNTLESNWMTDGPMDFEYKKYILLAYLQKCKSDFSETKLYPPLGDLMRHYQNLHDLKTSVEQMQQSFPREFSGIDFKKLQLQYEQHIPNDEHIQTITDIVEFAMPSIKNTIEDGKLIYDFVEQHIEITPVGIVPVYNSEGYVLINEDNSKDVHVYQYQYSVIQSVTENLRSLSLHFLSREVRSITNSIENIKLSLTRRFTNMPQPATYLCLSKISIPMIETLLPVAKRVMITRVLT